MTRFTPVLRFLAIACTGTAAVTAVAQDYGKFIGQHQRFCGLVVEVTQPFKRECEYALMLGSGADRWKFAAVVPRALGTALKPGRLLNHEICVSGIVTEEKKKPYILVTDPTQLEVVRPPASEDPTRVDAPPVPPGVVHPCDEGATSPKIIKEVKPEYTVRAMRDKARGKVEIRVIVNEDGSVGDLHLLKALHPDLDTAALAALRQWKFKPGTQFGKPVPTVIEIEFTFTLR